MKKIIFIFFVITGIFVIQGCERDEVIVNPPSNNTSANGIYILSEGNGTAGSAKLSFFNTTQNTFTDNIFSPGNLGLYPDGLLFADREVFIAEQGNFGSAGKVYRLDSNGKILNSASVGTNPYSLAAANGKLYITSGPANSVSVLNKSNLSYITVIGTGVYPQEVISIGNKIFAANNGAFGGVGDSTISVISAVFDQRIADIKVRQRPSSLAVTNDGKLLAGCTGSASEGIIYIIDPQNYSILDSFIINNGSASGFDKDISVDKNSNNIYFISDLNNIVKLDLVTKSHSVFISNPNTQASYFYGYSYDSNSKKHFIADAKNFAVNGNLIVFDENGNKISTYTTGIAPRRIVVK
ncbi:MAG: hypothetical protein JST15_13870 [Bacteroidetes bacterium]|nr:hypothetical protein [Bacteroidota bacterium]